jgi:hypothetical protein
MSAHATNSSAVHSDFSGKVEAIQDLKTYLIALYSYADQFAAHRNLSFQKHLMTVMGVSAPRTTRRNRRCRSV